MNHTRYDEHDLHAINAGIRQAYGWKEDAGETIFFARALDYVKSKTYSRKTPHLTGLDLVPVNTEYPAYVQNIIWRSYDEVGLAKVIANYADNLPRADVKGQENSAMVKSLGDSYGYNIFEIRASQATGAGLDTRRAAAARRAVDEKMNSIALVGDADFGMVGVLNHPNIGETVLAHGSWSAADTKGQHILDDLIQWYTAIITQSKGVHKPTVVGLPTAAYTALYTKRIGSEDMNAPTVASRFLTIVGDMGNPTVQLRNMPELAAAGTGGTTKGVMGEFTLDNLELPYPSPFEQLPPEMRNLETIVNCIARVGGVIVYYPLAFSYAEGM